jgi:Transposase IS116/IS110/IS902 family
MPDDHRHAAPERVYDWYWRSSSRPFGRRPLGGSGATCEVLIDATALLRAGLAIPCLTYTEGTPAPSPRGLPVMFLGKSIARYQVIAPRYQQSLCPFRSVCEQAIELASADSEACRRLRGIPGIGPISATAVVATMGDPKVFKNGRRTEGFSRNVRRAAPTAPCGAIGDARRRSMIHPSDGESTQSRTSLEHRDGSCGPGLIRSGNGVGFHRQKS